MNNVIPFDFDGQPVRVLLDDDGSEWFVGRDVATVLGYSRPHDAIRKRCKGASIRRPLSGKGGTQETQLIREPDIYRLIVGSRLPAAERFEAWLFEKVLPQLRRTGRYVIDEEETPDPEVDLPENSRAQRLVDAGRVFSAVSRIIKTAEGMTPERLEQALAVTGNLSGVDLKGILEQGGYTLPVLEQLPPDDEMAAMADLYTAWYAAFGTRTLSAAQLVEEVQAMHSDPDGSSDPVYPDLADAAGRLMGEGEWGAVEISYRLRSWKGRIVNGLRLGSDGKGKDGVRSRMRRVQGRLQSKGTAAMMH